MTEREIEIMQEITIAFQDFIPKTEDELNQRAFKDRKTIQQYTQSNNPLVAELSQFYLTQIQVLVNQKTKNFIKNKSKDQNDANVIQVLEQINKQMNEENDKAQRILEGIVDSTTQLKAVGLSSEQLGICLGISDRLTKDIQQHEKHDQMSAFMENFACVFRCVQNILIYKCLQVMEELNNELQENEKNIKQLSIQKIYKILFNACKIVLKHYQQFTTKLQSIYIKKQNPVPKKLKLQPGQTLKRTYQNKIRHENGFPFNSPLNQQTQLASNPDKDEIAQQLSQQLEDGMRFQQLDEPKSNFLSRLSHDLQNSDDYDGQNPNMQQPMLIQDQQIIQNTQNELLGVNGNVQGNPGVASKNNSQDQNQPNQPIRQRKKRANQKQKAPVFKLILDDMEENTISQVKKQNLRHQVEYQIPDQFLQIIKEKEMMTLTSSIVRGGESLGSLQTVEAALHQQDNEPQFINFDDGQSAAFFENYVGNQDFKMNQEQNIEWEEIQNQEEIVLSYNKIVKDVKDFTDALQLYNANKCTLIQQSPSSILVQPNQQSNK